MLINHLWWKFRWPQGPDRATWETRGSTRECKHTSPRATSRAHRPLPADWGLSSGDPVGPLLPHLFSFLIGVGNMAFHVKYPHFKTWVTFSKEKSLGQTECIGGLSVAHTVLSPSLVYSQVTLWSETKHLGPHPLKKYLTWVLWYFPPFSRVGIGESSALTSIFTYLIQL